VAKLVQEAEDLLKKWMMGIVMKRALLLLRAYRGLPKSNKLVKSFI
jgi:hypothetical protein